MILKNAFIAALLIAATPTLVMAANTAVFEGRISNPTCSVSVNGGTASSVTVLLPTVPLSSFALPNAVAGETPFTIAVSNCDYPGNFVRPRFVGNNPNANGRLPNVSGPGYATGVVLEIGYTEGGLDAFDVRDWTASPNDEQGIRMSGPSGNRSGSKAYYVRYYRPASTPITIGKVFASVQYSIIYP